MRKIDIDELRRLSNIVNLEVMGPDDPIWSQYSIELPDEVLHAWQQYHSSYRTLLKFGIFTSKNNS